MINKQIIFKRYGYLTIRVFSYADDPDKYDIRFTSSAWPHWRIRHPNCDEHLMKELLQIYTIRAWLFQWLPPRLVHWLLAGK